MIEINDLLIKHYLKNVMFITGTAYAGKSTMVKMLAEKYGINAEKIMIAYPME